MRILVTGGAGFIGSNLIARLLKDNHEVIACDNLYLGREEFLTPFSSNRQFQFLKEDLLDLDAVLKATSCCDLVFHLAANSDISLGREKTDLDLQLGTLTTYNVLEAMRINKVPHLIFASTSAIYGEATVLPTPESYGPLQPISLYGASKLAAEGFITAFCHNYGIQAWMFRFGNVIGFNATHGVFYDFIHRLKAHGSELRSLGDGAQAKPYIHVGDLIDGMLFGYAHAKSDVNVFNLATEGNTSVRHIADAIIQAMNLHDVHYDFTGTKRGWIGDVPIVSLDTRLMRELGWKPHLSSDGAVSKAAEELVRQFGSEASA
jgi:UDP-glucose 4-epimerase